MTCSEVIDKLLEYDGFDLRKANQVDIPIGNRDYILCARLAYEENSVEHKQIDELFNTLCSFSLKEYDKCINNKGTCLWELKPLYRNNFKD